MAVELKELTKRSENYSQWYNALRIRHLGKDAASVGRYV